MFIILISFAALLVMGKHKHLSLNISVRWSNGSRNHQTLLWGRYPSGMMFIPWADRVGIAVAGAWLALRASGRWRSEPSWIDRLGRALGWAWIAAAAVVWGLTFL
jgi:hypothetical protein